MIKILLGLIPVLLLPTSVLAHTENIRINITKDGFDPQEVTIHQHSTIEFVNLSDQERWPASNDHPTHTLYPEFDPKSPLKPGQIWKFKFSKAGSWHYHDHLYPHQRGTIIVETEEGTKSTNSLDQIWQLIKQLWEKIKIFSPQKALSNHDFKSLTADSQFDYLTKMAGQKGAKETWQYLKTIFQGETGSSGNIHDLAHLTGGLIFDHEGIKGLKLCGVDFAFGCYHGFLDKAFSNSLAGLNEAEASCSKLGNPMSGPYGSCVHGIGHGIASFYQTNNLAYSLLACERLNSGQTFCFDGVFMEFERGAPPNFYRSEDPYYPCSNLDNKYVFACSRNQPNLLMNRFGKNFREVADICLNSNSVEFKEGCINSLGFIAASQSKGQPQVILSLCQQINSPDDMAKCVTAGAGELIFQNTPGWQQNSYQLCNSLSPNHQAYCQQYLHNLIKDYNRS